MLGTHHRMLKLRTTFAILCGACPFIGSCDILPDTRVNHGLYREDMTYLHDRRSLVIAVVADRRWGVKQLTHTMTRVGANHRAVTLLRTLLNRITDVFVQLIWLHHRNSSHHTSICGVHQIDRWSIWFAHKDGLIQIAMKSVQVWGNVQVDNIALLQDTIVWNTMTNHLIHTRADRFRETVVVQWRWVHATGDGFVMD